MATIQRSHDSFWTEFWQRTAVSLGNAVVQNLWVSLQFLAGSSSRAGTVAPGLFGPWVFTDTPPWSGDYTLDYVRGPLSLPLTCGLALSVLCRAEFPSQFLGDVQRQPRRLSDVLLQTYDGLCAKGSAGCWL